MRKINQKQKQERVETLLELIDSHPEAITLNVSKLMESAMLKKNRYQIINRTWNEMKHVIKFKRI